MNTKQKNKPAAKDLSDAALIDILLTVDGQGKQAKGTALSELLKRAYDEGRATVLETLPVDEA